MTILFAILRTSHFRVSFCNIQTKLFQIYSFLLLSALINTLTSLFVFSCSFLSIVYTARRITNNITNIMNTAQKMKFSIKDFFHKCDQILNQKLHFLCSATQRYVFHYFMMSLFYTCNLSVASYKADFKRFQ